MNLQLRDRALWVGKRQTLRAVLHYFARYILLVSLLSLALFVDSTRVRPQASAPNAIPVAQASGLFNVNSPDDLVDANLANGICDAAPGVCTLRAAIQQANAIGGAVINLPAGVYTLTLSNVGGVPEDLGLTGDLDLARNITLNGPSPNEEMAIIDGNAADRVLDIHSGSVELNRVNIRNAGNVAGGILTRGNSNLTLTNSALFGNSGGGLNNTGSGVIDITNSTISGNSSAGGGGIYTNGGAILLANVTITGNSGATFGGGGIRVDEEAVLVMKNTILAGNTGSPGADCLGPILSAGFNLIGNSSGCTFSTSSDLIGQNPQLGPLQDNGGSGFTHALLLNSPALNAGDPNGCKRFNPADSLLTDQRGTGRPQGGKCDIGAYEVPAVKFSATNVTAEENDGSASVGVALAGPSAYTVTVVATTSNGSAIAGSDYLPPTTNIVTITPFATSASFAVPILEDNLDEDDETANLSLSNPGSATLDSPSTATLTIADTNPPPSVQFSAGAYAVNETVGQATIPINLSAVSGKMITVSYTATGGTASAVEDFTNATGTVSFSPGETAKAFNLTILDDRVDEPDETVNLAFSSLTNVTLGAPGTAVLTIVDNDLPTIYFPLVLRDFISFFTGSEREPNNTASQANGPLASGQPVTGLPNDSWDVFFFTSKLHGMISVTLNNFNQVGQLQLYYQSTARENLVKHDPDSPFQITVTDRPPGLYYVLIFTASPNPNSTTPYSLGVTYP
jgi:hypothetical protein